MSFFSKFSSKLTEVSREVNTSTSNGGSLIKKSLKVSPTFSKFTNNIVNIMAKKELSLTPSTNNKSKLKISNSVVRDMKKNMPTLKKSISDSLSRKLRTDALSSEDKVRTVEEILREKGQLDEALPEERGEETVVDDSSKSKNEDEFYKDPDTDEEEQEDADEETEEKIIPEKAFEINPQDLLADMTPRNLVEEVQEGSPLEDGEKPSIVAVLNEDITNSGYPKRNVIFIKKLTSTRFKTTEMKVLRKNFFVESEYKVIASLDPDDIELDEKYRNFVSQNLPYKDGVVGNYSDGTITANSAYVYKLEVLYSPINRRKTGSDEEDSVQGKTVSPGGTIVVDGAVGTIDTRIED